ncbi:TetR/AcrR family transcriptional regulator [Rubellimicrobium roseum]|uniref:TetR/AcrR family transcriptional regulator n=1 Tax=Rubellimicrobium roseum TaxID=687525 RepID=A0A5C4N8W2_9RHOB|nr:TetR/AcrR family transcriptional regulator [Rubellimicrobium roseum]TNC71294.1 TetR/AcrR family transcriptional regulator [Rubellimicrobium roseum]
MAVTKPQDTRTRILDVAHEAVLAKGFDATSIEEIVAAVEITKGGFFYHFPDKNALARALIERYLAHENKLLDGVMSRAHDLSDDPLQVALIALKFMAELLEDMPNGHPGCIVATAVYQDRLFDAGVREMNRKAVLSWRTRFRSMIDDIAAVYPPREPVDFDGLADMVNGVVEGGIVLSRALRQPTVTAQQVLLFRTFIKLLFSPRIQ